MQAEMGQLPACQACFGIATLQGFTVRNDMPVPHMQFSGLLQPV